MNHNKWNLEKIEKSKISLENEKFQLKFCTDFSSLFGFKMWYKWFCSNKRMARYSKVPAGLHYRMNLATGKKEAKLLVEENDAESDTG